ncbi:hypothetical protein O7626_40225 [Micromonospora sp. WMMD1102]|uniref:hypothetical protein n=1 Tax=Micromonospora sp. WMMD1102 TaxID=3016105 RepID=UPI0024158D25|nr:hypothetical protein [Micromonospora sp. WMMD1102]MDG4792045.1 hypothetical protein [Micromonospora sp. WMMD1102]
MNPDPLAPLDKLRAELARQTTPVDRARVWGLILDAWPDLHRAIADARAADVRAARQTMKDTEIAERLGKHFTTVSRIAREAGRAPKT